MKNGEENLKKEKKHHGSIFWLIWFLVTGSILGLCLGFVMELEQNFYLYDGRTTFFREWNNKQLRTYCVYALSDYKDDFRMAELENTNFRYAVYDMGDEVSVPLSERKNYLVSTLSEEQLAKNEHDLFVFTATIGENTTIDYNIDSLWSRYGYISNPTVYRGYNARTDEEIFDIIEDATTNYCILAAVAEPVNLNCDDLITQGVEIGNWIYDLRFVPIVVGCIAGVFFVFCGIKFLIAFFRFLGKCWRWMKDQWRGNLPLFWRLVVICGAVLLVELIIVIGCISEDEIYVMAFFWGLQSLLVCGLFIITGLQLRRVTDGAKRLAAGDLTSKINTKHLLYDMRVIGETLNSTGSGLEKAVDDRMKSEHFKTELISNVSHDIKTPLTSIISYVQLLKDQPENEPANREYLETLERQSVRLKKLLEDLIEASKASTGNLKADLQPCDVNTVLSQILGEYEEKLNEKELDLRIRLPEERVNIMADTQHLQRVLDNLLVNISKYAQPGTRAYVNLEATDKEARIELKNTSREPLNLTSDELLERFTRGDSSRGSEGNGLGLSIAQSLTELMGGQMELVVDGDLFKVILRFPRTVIPVN